MYLHDYPTVAAPISITPLISILVDLRAKLKKIENNNSNTLLKACLIDAKKYTSKKEWESESPKLFKIALTKNTDGWFDLCVVHMDKQPRSRRNRAEYHNHKSFNDSLLQHDAILTKSHKNIIQ